MAKPRSNHRRCLSGAVKGFTGANGAVLFGGVQRWALLFVSSVMSSFSPAQLQRFPWVVCDRASLRPCDLADAFLGAADTIADLLKLPRPDGTSPAGLSSSSVALLQELAADSSSCVAESASEEALEALEELSRWLESRSPAGFCFGSHPGDGSCFGFWLSEDWAEALEERGFDCENIESCALLLQAAEDYGLTPETFCDGYCGEAEGYSAEEAGADYAQQLAEDCGTIDWRNLSWPLTYIDWKAAWRDLEIGDNYGAVPTPYAGTFWILRSI
jgi:hypothetical protein